MSTIAVRTLCAFTAKRGDLDMRFTPAPTALEGMAGHARVAARRGRGYQKEVSLEASFEELTVRGRADGVDAAASRLDECKTFRGEFARIPANHQTLHWAQAKLYGAMLCRRDDLPSVQLDLVYLNVDTDQETVLSRTFPNDDLQAFFYEHCGQYLAWWRSEEARRVQLRTQLSALEFPYADIRPGQQELMESVAEAVTERQCLLAQAPTGIGKTLGVLFPLIKALACGSVDRVFYLTAKTPGRFIALQALSELVSATKDNHLRVLELVAKDKACVNRNAACHPDACPLARGFYDRLAGARDEALAIAFMDAKTVAEVAARHHICPYYLSHDLARWADVVVGDYNYYLDSSAMLYALAQENDWRVAVAVDEAHNLLPRARQMYSTTLEARQLKAAQEVSSEPVYRCLERIEREWKQLLRTSAEDYALLPDAPTSLIDALDAFVSAAGEEQVQSQVLLPDPLRAFHFVSLHFLRLADHLGTHSFVDLQKADPSAGGRPSLCIRNVIPAEFIRARFESAATSVLFSATLGPRAFNLNVLGLPSQSVYLDVTSPFDSDQLKIQVVPNISTRFAHRRRSIERIITAIREQYAAQPGNYLVFTSSFEYLSLIHERLRQSAPDIPAWCQLPRMSERDRTAFVDRLRTARGGVAFAVLGGAFGEGIDLPGDQLVGAFIATLGLPQVNPVNEAMRQCLENAFGCGYEYTYLYPGVQKIAQAAGRIIRATTDEGTLVLLDDRYGHPELQELLPRWWRWPRLDQDVYAE